MYHLVAALLDPFTLLFLLTAVGIANLWRRRVDSRRRLVLVAVPFAVLAVVSLPATAYLALGSLEWPYPPQAGRPRGVDTIVVLSGAVHPPNRVRPEAELGEDSLYRCLHAARLYRRTGPCLVVASGGKVDSRTPGPTVAAAMRDFLIEQGVADSDLLLEDRSRSTYENARNTAVLLRERGIEKIVLVTDASHMLRAERCFLAQGIEVYPSGCRHQATEFRWSLLTFLPRPWAARDVQRAAHEWMGLAWYRLHGRI